MLILGALLLFGAIYFYTWRLADCMDKHAEHTNRLIAELTAKVDALGKR